MNFKPFCPCCVCRTGLDHCGNLRFLFYRIEMLIQQGKMRNLGAIAT